MSTALGVKYGWAWGSELCRRCVWIHLLLQQSHLLFLSQNSDGNVALIHLDCHRRCNHSIRFPGVLTCTHSMYAHVHGCSLKGSHLVMMKAVRAHAWTVPALTPHGAWMLGAGLMLTLWMSALMLSALPSLSSPPTFTKITTSPKCSLPSFVTLRLTWTHEWALIHP